MLGLLRLLQHKLRQPFWLLTTSFLAACCVAGIVTLVMGVPVPRVHDEFAYLLGADTYASGRIVNSSHAHWQHFESFHVLTDPVYLPKYAPGQSLILAAGLLLGHPFIGVCLSTGLAAASLAWMLVAWLPRRWNWLAWLVAVLHPGLQIKWGHSYMGGAVGMIGACLLLGALGSSRRRLSAKHSAIAAIGILILANSRPFEGAVLTSCVGLSLLIILCRHARESWSQVVRQLIIPSGIVLMCGAVLIMFNNYRVTGSVAQLPYQMYEAQYGLSPLFLWQSPKNEQPTYRHPVMERYYQHENAEIKSKFSTPWDILREKTRALSELIHFFCGGTQYLLLVGLPLLLRRSRFRLAVLILIPVLIAAVCTPWTLTHYAAPAAPLIILITLAGIAEIAHWLYKRAYSQGRPAVGKRAVDGTDTLTTSKSIFPTMILAVVVFLILTLHSITIYRNDQRANNIPWALRRQDILQQLTLNPGKYLVFVRYADNHNSHEEWVYNRADLDNANVVWARQISPKADAQLVDYFADRKVLIIDADRTDTTDANRAR